MKILLLIAKLLTLIIGGVNDFFYHKSTNCINNTH